MSESKFYFRPRVGDVWNYKVPGKRRKTKTVGRISMSRYRRGPEYNAPTVRHPTVSWKRLPKGAYSGIRVKWLLKYGTLVRRNSLGQSRK